MEKYKVYKEKLIKLESVFFVGEKMPIEVKFDNRIVRFVKVFEIINKDHLDEIKEKSPFTFEIGIPGEYIFISQFNNNEVEILRVFLHDVGPIYLEKVRIFQNEIKYEKMSPFKDDYMLKYEEFLKKILSLANVDIPI